jgi:hypothetical protein
MRNLGYVFGFILITVGAVLLFASLLGFIFGVVLIIAGLVLVALMHHSGQTEKLIKKLDENNRTKEK